MDNFDTTIGTFLFGCLLVCGIGYHTETQIDTAIENIAGEDYIKVYSDLTVAGSGMLNEIYDKNGNCVGIYYISHHIYKYEMWEVKNFGKCEAL